MKRIFLVFLSLLAVFFGTWGFKANNPINRPDNLQEEAETPWYEMRYVAPKADAEWYLDPEIPLNYIPVPGEDELYMVVDDSGNITGYRQRKQLADGTWLWEDVNPDIPENYEKVDGLDNVYKVTNEDGSTSYYLYVRNEDDTFCFVPVDEKGNPLDDGENADVIADYYVHEVDNIYAVYNEDNVKMGYRERVQDKDGNYIWKVVDAPELPDAKVGNGSGLVVRDEGNSNTSNGQNNQGNSSGETTKKQNGDGTYVITETIIDTVTEGGYTVKYQTTVYSTYSKNGDLLSTKKDGPYEVSKVPASSTPTINKDKIASTLSGELSRVSGSVEFNKDKANDVLAKLNAERKSQGLNTLSMSSGSEAYKLACIRAADMAIYNHGSSSSPMYGSLDSMVARFGCSSTHASENIWKSSAKTSSQIHTRFQSNEGSRKVRMSSGYTEVGIAVVEKDGQIYIAEIYLK